MKRSRYKIINDLRFLLDVVEGHKKTNDKIVFTNGCFDLFHAGHVHCLEKAKNFGDILIVAINSDKSVKSIKGDTRPIIPEEERALIVASMAFVDYVTVFDEDTPFNLIMRIKPNVLIKGGDWDVKNIVGNDIVITNGGEVYCIDYTFQTSSTSIIKKILTTQSITG